jgi:hypothetical protein
MRPPQLVEDLRLSLGHAIDARMVSYGVYILRANA